MSGAERLRTDELAELTGDAGVAASALTPSPDSNCTSATSAGREYWFCSTERSWATARQKCQAVAGRDLVVIDTSTENDFVYQHVPDDSWIGATDQTVEGAWRWAPTGAQFWQGTSGGSAVGGAYTKWATGQPNDIGGQDCAIIDDSNSGRWSDESCSGSREYVCEADNDQCPNDPAKTSPGQCGCSVPDTDGDGDGTADCVDGCISDPNKTSPGQCGCGTADTDSDGDGTPNCNDRCPNDPAHTAPDCSPESGCTRMTFGGSAYWLCSPRHDWATARTKCTVAGYQLARIDSAAENQFIEDEIASDRWVGGSDLVTEGTWRWEIGGDTFWLGDNHGAAVGNAVTLWDSGEPSTSSSHNCLQIMGDGEWNADGCSDTEQYICEDMCPDDVTKSLPGVCGCGIADTDTDQDGVPDCLDECDADPNKQDPGLCGCGNPDIDSDGDGPLDCQEACPGDPDKIAPGVCGCGKADTDSNLDGTADCVHCEGTPVDAAWPMSGSCRGGAHRSPFVGPSGADELWTFAIDVTSRDAPSVGPGDIVYVGASDGLYAIAADGSGVVWRYPTTQPVRTSPALDAAGRLFFGADDGSVYALSASSGALLWSSPTGSPVRASPTLALDQGYVVVGNDVGVVFALDPANGATVWTYAIGGSIVSAPAVVMDGRILVGSTNRFVYALHPDAGMTDAARLSWRADLGAAVRTSAVTAQVEPVVYFGTDAGQLVKLRIANGSEVWRFTAAGPIVAGASLGALGAIHFVAQGGVAYMLEDRGLSAYQRWAYALASPSATYVTVGADGLAYVGGASRIWALRPLGDDSVRVAWEQAIAGGVVSAAAIRADGALVFAGTGVLRLFGAALGQCPIGSRCATYRGVNYCGHSMPGTPFTVPLACPENGVCPNGEGCTALFGFQFCYLACNLGDEP